jgi:hypothetical protein
MKRGSTIFLREVVILIGIAALAIYVFALPWLAGVAAEWLPAYLFLRILALAVWYATVVPFYFALYQVFKLLGFIDWNASPVIFWNTKAAGAIRTETVFRVPMPKF